MLFPALKLLERIKMRVAISKAHHETQCNLPTSLMIEESAAISIAQRPTLSMNDQARLVLGGIDVPQFLHAQPVDLRFAVSVQMELPLQYLGQVAACTFSKEGIFGVQLQSRLIVALAVAFAIDAHVTGRNALHAAILIIEDFGGGESREYLDAQSFGLFRQPAAQIAQRTGIGALVVHPARRGNMRHRQLAALRQEPVLVVPNRRICKRAAHVAPVWQQLIQRPGIDHRARKNVSADFRAFFQNAHGQFLTSTVGQLLQPDRRSQPRRAPADDDDVIGHRFPFAHMSSIRRSGRFPHPVRLPYYSNVLPSLPMKILDHGVNLWP